MTKKTRSEDRIFLSLLSDGAFLPEAPGAADVVAQAHRRQHKKAEEACADGELDQP